MRKSRFTTEQILQILRESQAGSVKAARSTSVQCIVGTPVMLGAAVAEEVPFACGALSE